MKNLPLLAVAVALSGCGQGFSQEAGKPPSREHRRAAATPTLRPDALDAIVTLLADKDGFRASEAMVQNSVHSSCSGERAVDKAANMIILDYRCHRGGVISLYAEFMPTQKYVNQIVVRFTPARYEDVDRRVRKGLGRPISDEGAYVAWSPGRRSGLPGPLGAAVPTVALQRDGDVATFSLTAEPPGEE
jgi:hypothetical protein